MVQLLREISHENVVKLVNVHINPSDMSLYLAFDYAEHDLYVSSLHSYMLPLFPFLVMNSSLLLLEEMKICPGVYLNGLVLLLCICLGPPNLSK